MPQMRMEEPGTEQICNRVNQMVGQLGGFKDEAFGKTVDGT